MVWHDYEKWKIAFIFSATLNLSFVIHFALFSVANLIVGKYFKRQALINKAHRKSPNFMHCFYFNVVMYTCVVVSAFFFIITTVPLSKSFVGDVPITIVYFLAAVLGIRGFLFCRDLYLFKNSCSKFTVLLVHGVFVVALVNMLVTQMGYVMAFIVIISEGDIPFINIGRLLKLLGYAGSPSYRKLMFVGCYATITFRAIIPISTIAISLVRGNPLLMNSYAMITFFFCLVVYGVVNTWQVNSTIARICKREDRIVEVPYRNLFNDVDESLKPEDEIPPCYQEACQQQAGLSVISSSAAINIESEDAGDDAVTENNRQGAGTDDDHVTQSGTIQTTRTNIAAIILDGFENTDSSRTSTISHA